MSSIPVKSSNITDISNIFANSGIGGGDVHSQLEQSSERLDHLLQRAAAAEERSTLQVTTPPVLELDESKSTPANVWDWSKGYSKWDGYEDMEELQAAIEGERSLQDKLVGQMPAQHYHDHGEERRFFELPEEEKMRQCERYRKLGNGLYTEGLIPKAAHMYKTALSYYEYCFPELESDQALLDELRRACLCNISLCYYRLGEFRLAQGAASKVLRAAPTHSKALYRRACAFRALDEYADAQKDLAQALEACPADPVLLQEHLALLAQMKGARALELELGKRLLKGNEGAAEEGKSPAVLASSSKATKSAMHHMFTSDLPMEPFLPMKNRREL